MSRAEDEHLLLDLVEGLLPGKEAAAARRGLPPRTLAYVDRLIDDRRALRSLPEPELPCDIVARIEPMLARPMLMEPLATATMTDAAALRRQHRRRTHRVRWGRLAAAAALLAAASAAIWAGFIGFRTGPDRGASSDRSTAAALSSSNPAAQSAATAWNAQASVIHHDAPAWQSSAGTPTRMTAADSPSAAAQALKAPRPALAQFAIVMYTRDGGEARQALQGALAPSGQSIALVRNFSFDEARRLEQQWLLARAGGAPADATPPAVASTSSSGHADRRGDSINELARRVRQQLRAQQIAGSTVKGIDSQSGVIVGDQALAPTLEQQLELSSRGAAYTVTIPVASLEKLLERLAFDHKQTVVLRMLGPSAEESLAADAASRAGESHPPSIWAEEAASIRKAVQGLAENGEDAAAIVPVIIRTEPATHGR